MTEMIPKIIQAVVGQDFIYVCFHDGTIRLPDAALLVHKAMFSPSSGRWVFCDRLTVLNDTVSRDMTGTRETCPCLKPGLRELYKSCSIVEVPRKGGLIWQHIF